MDFATRAVVFDLSQRLRLSENQVRDLAYQAEVLQRDLPGLCDLFVAGRIGAAQVRAAVENTVGIDDAGVMAEYDRALAGIAVTTRAGEFARRSRLTRERLTAETLQERHERAAADRRVAVEADLNAMSWIHAYVPMIDAARVDARLTAEAAGAGKRPGENRSKAQLRADLLVAWLTGDGSPNKAVTPAHPVVVIDADGRYAELLGYGPIPATAAGRALRDAPSFRKVIADPVKPATLTLDARSYRPSADQRRWLTLTYGLNDASAPYVAPDAEVDHVVEWQHGGPTNVVNLIPLKPRLHRLKSVTRIRFDPGPGGGIRVRTPTGYDSDPPGYGTGPDDEIAVDIGSDTDRDARGEDVPEPPPPF